MSSPLSTPDGRRRRLSAPERREVIERAATEVFAERGYGGASMDAIARRSGVSVPVVYDHFSSKLELHRRLLERHTDELLSLWRSQLHRDAPAEERIPASIDAWARYVEAHPFAWRMLFRDTSGDPEVQAALRAVNARGRAALTEILAREPGAEHLGGAPDAEALEMAVELIRSGLTGLAVWWGEHPHVAREQVVATAINVVWLGFERVRRGEGWEASR